MHPGWIIILSMVGLAVLAVIVVGILALCLGGDKEIEDMYEQCEEDRE